MCMIMSCLKLHIYYIFKLPIIYELAYSPYVHGYDLSKTTYYIFNYIPIIYELAYSPYVHVYDLSKLPIMYFSLF